MLVLGCVLYKNKKKIKIIETKIKFKKLHDNEIDQYIKTNEWFDKAGSYAIQGFAESLLSRLMDRIQMLWDYHYTKL